MKRDMGVYDLTVLLARERRLGINDLLVCTNHFTSLSRNERSFPWVFFSGTLRYQRGNESIWVNLDILTKSRHFIPVPPKRNIEMLGRKFVDHVVRYSN